MTEIELLIQQAKENKLTYLDLSFRNLSNLPDSLSSLKQLTRLDLSGNQLTSLPESLTTLTQLIVLNLNSNQLSNLPKKFINLTRLTALNLRSNQLANIPTCILGLEQLTELDLSYNKLTSIPETLSQLKQLIRLDLSGNYLTQLPESISTLNQLADLDLNRNQLTNLPQSISALTQLRRLDLCDNQLTNLPQSIAALTQLTELYLCDNQLIDPPESLAALTQLTVLYLSNNQLTTLPHSFSALTKLNRLGLRYNQLTILPDTLVSFTQLTELDLSSNQLGCLPPSIRALTQLTRLDLSSNCLTSLPESLAALTKLTKLYLSYNQLTRLPESISSLTRLNELYLSNNRLVSLPESISALTQLTVLNLHDNQLKALPSDLAALSQLTELYLSNNQLATLSDNFFRFPQLKWLGLRHNQLTTLPENLSSLTQFIEFDLSHNHLTTLPKNLNPLTHLIRLNLSSNLFTTLPNSLLELTQLTELNLSNNQLTSLPDDLGTLVQLVRLDLSNNLLANLPESLGELIPLVSLNLEGNQLKTLPESVIGLTQLNELLLAGNWLEKPPQRIAEQDINEIRLWFEQEKFQQTHYRYETKLMLLGPENAGKTTLRKKLEDIAYQLKDEGRTVGVDIWDWHITLESEAEYTQDAISQTKGIVRVFDFGGQPIQFLAHQFFMSPDAFYVLMKSPNQSDAISAYWLQCIAAMPHQQVVQPFINLFKDQSNSIDIPALYEHKSFDVKEPISVNLKHDSIKKIQRKLEDLEEHVAKHLHRTRELSLQYWDQVKANLASKYEAPYISLIEYRKTCNQIGMAKIEHQDSCLRDLHRLGYALHFAGTLDQIVFLNSNWIIKALYSLFTPETQLIQNGYFSKSKLMAQWSQIDKRIGQPAYSDEECSWLFLILQKGGFGLCYQSDEQDKDRFLVPFQLPEDHNDSYWQHCITLQKSGEIEQYYLAFRFLPDGVLALLSVELHYLLRSDQNTNLWKNGMVLHYERAQARIEQLATVSYGTHIALEFIGPQADRQELRDLITGQLKNILLRHYQLFPIQEEFIPCRGCIPGDRKGYRYKLEETTIKCPLCGQVRDIDETSFRGNTIIKGDKIVGEKTTIYANNSIVNSKSRLDQVVQSFNTSPQHNEFAQLVKELKQILENIPELNEIDTQPLIKPVEAISNELQEPSPDTDILHKYAERLKAAAETVKNIAPPVITIVANIIQFIKTVASA